MVATATAAVHVAQPPTTATAVVSVLAPPAVSKATATATVTVTQRPTNPTSTATAVVHVTPQPQFIYARRGSTVKPARLGIRENGSVTWLSPPVP